MNIVFRKFPEGDIIALFCGEAYFLRNGFVMSYQNIGQHSEASAAIIRSTKLATEQEYMPLLKELESIYGETIKPVKRLTC